jgi:hypothetical protein
MLHETHLDLNDASKLDLMWRGQKVISLGTSNSRGTIILYNENQFYEVIHSYGDPDGRTTWLITRKKVTISLFSGIYGPNRDQHEYYKTYTQITKGLISKYNVDNIYIGGDFNVELCKTIGRYSNKYKPY